MSSAVHPEPAPRTAYHHGDLPAALKREALALIGRHGVEAFSLRQAAQALGVSPSAVYRHFTDKAALLAAVAADGFVDMSARFVEAMDAAADRAPARSTAQVRFVALGRAYVEFALAQPARFAVMFGPYGAGNPAVSVAVQPRARSPYLLLQDTLDQLAAQRVMHPARRPGAEVLAWSAIHGLATLLASGAMTASAREVTTMSERVALDVVRALGRELPRVRGAGGA